MKKFIALWLVLIVANLSGAQAQNRAGAFAAAAAPGQVPVPAAATPQITIPPAPAIPRPAIAGQPGQQQQEQLRVVADPATNSLVIYGTVQEYQNVKNILKELDAIPRQVLIEAMILQVSYRDTENFGVDYEILGKSAMFSGTALGSRGVLFSGALAAFLKDGGAGAIVGEKNSVRAFVTALLKDSRVKLLSSPSVLATDNRPARIQVGTEEPVPTGTVSSPTGSTGISSSTTVQYRNTGRILTIIPQVNSQGLVNLQVKAEVSQRGESVSFGGGSSAETSTTYPTFDTQDAETNAVVQDGETLVIGGLIGERRSKDRKGIPYLMDIPVIGRFFGTTTDDTTRTELIMLITPRVIRNRDESRQVTTDFKAMLEKVRAELERTDSDRARLLPPRPLPPLPDPNQYYQYNQQQPAPTNPPVGPRTSLPPVVDNVTVLSNDPITGRMMPPMAVPQEPVQVAASPTQPVATKPREQLSQTAASVLSAPPAYILSFTSPPPVAAPAAPAVPASPAQRQKSAGARRVWTVQVAAIAESSAAESLAQKLRQAGYDAYVRMTKSETKTWHRVRVGQLESQKDAADLRNILAAQKAHKDAYIAPY